MKLGNMRRVRNSGRVKWVRVLIYTCDLKFDLNLITLRSSPIIKKNYIQQAKIAVSHHYSNSLELLAVLDKEPQMSSRLLLWSTAIIWIMGVQLQTRFLNCQTEVTSLAKVVPLPPLQIKNSWWANKSLMQWWLPKIAALITRFSFKHLLIIPLVGILWEPRTVSWAQKVNCKALLQLMAAVALLPNKSHRLLWLLQLMVVFLCSSNNNRFNNSCLLRNKTVQIIQPINWLQSLLLRVLIRNPHFIRWDWPPKRSFSKIRQVTWVEKTSRALTNMELLKCKLSTTINNSSCLIPDSAQAATM